MDNPLDTPMDNPLDNPVDNPLDTPLVTPQDTLQNHSISSLAADVLGVLSSPDFTSDLIPSGRLVLVAHSMSAKVAYHVLYYLGNGGIDGSGVRIGFRVQRLLLLAPAPIRPLDLPPQMRAQQLRAYDSLESASWTMRFVLSHAPLDDDVVRRLASDAVGMSPGAKSGWLGEYGMKVDCTEVLRAAMNLVKGTRRAFRVRVLVGREDRVETVEKVQEETVDVLHSMGVNVGIKLVEGCGHLLPVEAAKEVVGEIESLLHT
jgi:pimeloyl-ACP methyl ester carboxylesterase